MSVILESQSGDELVVIEAFHASPEGEGFAWETSRHFRVGERVRYLGFLQDQYYRDHLGLGWVVRFEAADAKTYLATQTYFVTEECWQGVKKFFARRLLREPKSRKTTRP